MYQEDDSDSNDWEFGGVSVIKAKKMPEVMGTAQNGQGECDGGCSEVAISVLAGKDSRSKYDRHRYCVSRAKH